MVQVNKQRKVVKVDQAKYQRALNTLAEQLVAMVDHDYGDDPEFYQLEVENYLSDTITELIELANKLKQSGGQS